MSTDAGMNRGTNRPMSTARTNSIPLERSTPRSSLESPRDRLPSRPSPPSRAVAVPDAHRHEKNPRAINQSLQPITPITPITPISHSDTPARRVMMVCLSYIDCLSESHV